jgi:cytochrome bd ubiquinol oxidase subunit I
MNFPVWEVGGMGSGWIIGFIASFHVFISHFAIGGGAFLALTEQLAYKRNDERIYDYIRRHAKFFLLLTTVTGAITGVGIWWAIGLVSPNGTQTLLQNFSMFWAVEYLFFLAELVTFFVYYYTMDRIPKKLHLNIAWIYFGISFGTLFVINGILTFMLTNGVWPTSQNVWDGYFNPAFIPAMMIRLCIMFALAGIYALATASKEKIEEVRVTLLRYSAKWLLPSVILAPAMVAWYLFMLPPDTQHIIIAGISTMGEGNFSVLARTIVMTMVFAFSLVVMTFVGPYLNARHFSFPMAVVMMITALGFMLGEEYSREMMRKPYVIYNYMYSNGTLKTQLAAANKTGYFSGNTFSNADYHGLGANASPKEVGKLMFRYQCMSCHTANGSYRPMTRLLGERDETAIKNLLVLMRSNGEPSSPYHSYMPPLVGSKAEEEALAAYLYSVKTASDAEQKHEMTPPAENDTTTSQVPVKLPKAG